MTGMILNQHVNIFMPYDFYKALGLEQLYRGVRAKKSKCFFTYIHIDLFRFHPSIYSKPDDDVHDGIKYIWF